MSEVIVEEWYSPPGTDSETTLAKARDRARAGRSVVWHEHRKGDPCKAGKCGAVAP